MNEPLPSRPTPRTLALALLAVGLVGVQAVVFARAQADEYRAARLGRHWFTGPEQTRDLSFLSATACRSLSAVATAMPPDARVLLVSRVPFLAPYDFYLLPRRLRILVEVDEQLAERAAERFPHAAQHARDFLARIVERGQRLTPDHLREGLAASDWLVVFMGDVGTLPLGPDAPWLQRVSEHEAATLYRVVRGP